MRVVLVDPSRTVLKCVSRLLEARGHDARPFADERQALKCIVSDIEVDALITSAELNFMSGLELCWETRLLTTARRQIYVILMSSNQNRHTLAEALDSGADDFIGKPPVAEELYARLRAAERLASMQRELVRLATTDPLTGTRNRRAFFEGAQDAQARAAAGAALCAIMFDIDRFKRINDVHGHDVGDDVIRAVARTAMIEGVTVGRALVGRLGGEEFAILLEGRPINVAIEFAERLRSRIADLRFKTSTQILRVSCSFGVGEWQAGDTVDQLLKRTDVALYHAKKAGRDRVMGPEAIALQTGSADRTSLVRTKQRA